MLLLLPSLSLSPSLLIALSRRSLGLCRALLGALLPWSDQQQHHPQVVAVKAAQLTSPRRRRSHFGAFMALRLSSLCACTCACVGELLLAVALAVLLFFGRCCRRRSGSGRDCVASHFLRAAVAAAAPKTFCHSYNLPIVSGGRERATTAAAAAAHNGSSGAVTSNTTDERRRRQRRCRRRRQRQRRATSPALTTCK